MNNNVITPLALLLKHYSLVHIRNITKNLIDSNRLLSIQEKVFLYSSNVNRKNLKYQKYILFLPLF